MILAAQHDAGILLYPGGIVRGHDDGRAPLADGVQQLYDAAPGVRVQIAGRLVGQDKGRGIEHRTRYHDALLFAAGELVGKFIALVLHPHQLEDIFDAAVDLYFFFPTGALWAQKEIFLT